jgi:hypothetical protein
MLVCGEVNPPPVSTPGYGGILFTAADDLPGKARALAGTPLRIEHNGSSHHDVGRVLHGWTDARTGALWALAEIDVERPRGAVAAAAVTHGVLGGFSLGYKARVCRDPVTGGFKSTGVKEITELSIVREGAHPSCTIAAHHSI